MVQVTRRFRKVRRVVRQRHRTWMLSMSLATLGWGAWWLGLLLMRIAPAYAPPTAFVYGVSSALALAGLCTALLCIRAGMAWLLLTAIPLFASASLLSMPWLLPDGGARM